ncbi:hypothetical protein J7E97_31060 [Streptomyces sp. ISL-66]|uniref:hypothetical protein n=1 Tax=Streptomyces sp. ISL-66 TaxID=2819186 RepID=UPI001BE97CAB|nr:hypothetical protein [Streptomyces sp. ISL-66]MBT2472178.1 hypothetical protein [Streptomyces sp. ISL-66]
MPHRHRQAGPPPLPARTDRRPERLAAKKRRRDLGTALALDVADERTIVLDAGVISGRGRGRGVGSGVGLALAREFAAAAGA